MWKKCTLIALALVGLAWLGVKVFVPSYVTSLRENRERILRQDLVTMNQAQPIHSRQSQTSSITR